MLAAEMNDSQLNSPEIVTIATLTSRDVLNAGKPPRCVKFQAFLRLENCVGPSNLCKEELCSYEAFHSDSTALSVTTTHALHHQGCLENFQYFFLSYRALLGYVLADD